MRLCATNVEIQGTKRVMSAVPNYRVLMMMVMMSMMMMWMMMVMIRVKVK